MRAFCVGEKIFGGNFSKTEDNKLIFRSNFERVNSGSTTPGKNTIRKILESPELQEEELFDQELLTIMLSDGRLSEALPIPQLMKGNIQIGALREIKEVDELNWGAEEE